MCDNKRVSNPHPSSDDEVADKSKENGLIIRKGYIKPLKTVEELGAGDAVIEVLVAKIPTKASSRVLA